MRVLGACGEKSGSMRFCAFSGFFKHYRRFSSDIFERRADISARTKNRVATNALKSLIGKLAHNPPSPNNRGNRNIAGTRNSIWRNIVTKIDTDGRFMD